MDKSAHRDHNAEAQRDPRRSTMIRRELKGKKVKNSIQRSTADKESEEKWMK